MGKEVSHWTKKNCNEKQRKIGKPCLCLKPLHIVTISFKNFIANFFIGSILFIVRFDQIKSLIKLMLYQSLSFAYLWRNQLSKKQLRGGYLNFQRRLSRFLLELFKNWKVQPSHSFKQGRKKENGFCSVTLNQSPS